MVDVQRRSHGALLEGLVVASNAATIQKTDRESLAKSNFHAAQLRASFKSSQSPAAIGDPSTPRPYQSDANKPKLLHGDYTYHTIRRNLQVASHVLGTDPMPAEAASGGGGGRSSTTAQAPPWGTMPAMRPASGSTTNMAAWKAYGSPSARGVHRPPAPVVLSHANANPHVIAGVSSKQTRSQALGGGFRLQRPHSAPSPGMPWPPGGDRSAAGAAYAAAMASSPRSAYSPYVPPSMAPLPPPPPGTQARSPLGNGSRPYSGAAAAAQAAAVAVGAQAAAGSSPAHAAGAIMLGVEHPDPIGAGKTDSGRVMFEHTLPTDPYGKYLWEEQARKARASMVRHVTNMASAASGGGSGSRPGSARQGTKTSGPPAVAVAGGGPASRPRFASASLAALQRQGTDAKPPTVLGFSAADMTDDSTLPGPGDPRWAYTRLGRTQIERLQSALKMPDPSSLTRPASAPAQSYGGDAGGGRGRRHHGGNQGLRFGAAAGSGAAAAAAVAAAHSPHLLASVSEHPGAEEGEVLSASLAAASAAAAAASAAESGAKVEVRGASAGRSRGEGSSRRVDLRSYLADAEDDEAQDAAEQARAEAEAEAQAEAAAREAAAELEADAYVDGAHVAGAGEAGIDEAGDGEEAAGGAGARARGGREGGGEEHSLPVHPDDLAAKLAAVAAARASEQGEEGALAPAAHPDASHHPDAVVGGADEDAARGGDAHSNPAEDHADAMASRSYGDEAGGTEAHAVPCGDAAEAEAEAEPGPGSRRGLSSVASARSQSHGGSHRESREGGAAGGEGEGEADALSGMHAPRSHGASMRGSVRASAQASLHASHHASHRGSQQGSRRGSLQGSLRGSQRGSARYDPHDAAALVSGVSGRSGHGEEEERADGAAGTAEPEGGAYGDEAQQWGEEGAGVTEEPPAASEASEQAYGEEPTPPPEDDGAAYGGPGEAAPDEPAAAADAYGDTEYGRSDSYGSGGQGLRPGSASRGGSGPALGASGSRSGGMDEFGNVSGEYEDYQAGLAEEGVAEDAGEGGDEEEAQLGQLALERAGSGGLGSGRHRPTSARPTSARPTSGRPVSGGGRPTSARPVSSSHGRVGSAREGGMMADLFGGMDVIPEQSEAEDV